MPKEKTEKSFNKLEYDKKFHKEILHSNSC